MSSDFGEEVLAELNKGADVNAVDVVYGFLIAQRYIADSCLGRYKHSPSSQQNVTFGLMVDESRERVRRREDEIVHLAQQIVDAVASRQQQCVSPEDIAVALNRMRDDNEILAKAFPRPTRLTGIGPTSFIDLEE